MQKAMTIKEYLSLKKKPDNLYIGTGCSMEICEGKYKTGNGFLEIVSIGRAGGEPSGIWWVHTMEGPSICQHEDRFLYKEE